MTPRARAHACLVGAAFIFGTTFVTVKSAIGHAQPIPFLGARFLVGALVVAPFAARRPATKGETRGAGSAGLALLSGYVFQTIGLRYTSSSVSAFVTYLLVIFVPLLHALRTRRLPRLAVVVGVGVAFFGLGVLTGAGGVGLGRGELLTVAAAFGFALHILALEAIAGRSDPLRINVIQLSVVAGACLGPGFFLGGYRFPLMTWLAVLYTGVAASAVAFFLQIWGQTHDDATRASLVLLMEPVFAALLGAWAGDRLGWRGGAGAALILIGIFVTELSSVADRLRAG